MQQTHESETRIDLARLIVADLESRIPGKANATSGPGPVATVRYYVAGSPVVVGIMIFDASIQMQAVTEPAGGIAWGIKEYPASETGARHATRYIVEWFASQVDVDAMAAKFNTVSTDRIRFALHQVADHPKRGAEKSYDAVTGKGKVVDGQPSPGVSIRRDGDSYRFRLTDVRGDTFVWDEISMTPSSFLAFLTSMTELLASP